MHSCWTGWLHVKCWKWPPPSRHVRTWRTLSAVCSRTSCSVLISCQMLSFKASTVQGWFLYTISSKQRQRKKFGDLTCGNQGGHRSFEMILPWSGVISTQWERMPLSTICWGHGRLLMHGTGMNRHYSSMFQLRSSIYSRIIG